MYMNLKPNQQKRISFNPSTMTLLGFIAPPKILGPPLNLAPPKFNFLPRCPPIFCLKYLGPPLKWGGGGGGGGGCYHAITCNFTKSCTSLQIFFKGLYGRCRRAVLKNNLNDWF